MKTGQKLKTLRNLKNISLNKICFDLNISKGYLSELENDVRKNPSLVVLKKLSDFYNISIDDLVNEKLEITFKLMELPK